MREYVMTSKFMAGYIKCGFDENGRLVKFENAALLTDVQLQHIYNPVYFPLTESKFTALAGNKCTIEEVSELTFDRFWKEYDCKKGKIQTEKEWRKLTEEEKAKAIGRIKAFKFDCKSHNRELVYPERYLKHRRYDDE
jgi:hypothetical protein